MKKKLSSQEKFDKIWEEAGNDYMKSAGNLRYGQCLWNSAVSYAPEAVEPIRGTDNDCFYNDKKIESFLRELKKNLGIG